LRACESSVTIAPNVRNLLIFCGKSASAPVFFAITACDGVINQIEKKRLPQIFPQETQRPVHGHEPNKQAAFPEAEKAA
jgi:hypothetical protein